MISFTVDLSWSGHFSRSDIYERGLLEQHTVKVKKTAGVNTEIILEKKGKWIKTRSMRAPMNAENVPEIQTL